MLSNLAPVLALAVRRHGSRTAVSVGQRDWSYVELDRSSNRLAAYLRDIIRWRRSNHSVMKLCQAFTPGDGPPIGEL
jgi:non-ribosomal peptide synthetase component E (peptide arylation enzyme)